MGLAVARKCRPAGSRGEAIRSGPVLEKARIVPQHPAKVTHASTSTCTG